MALLLHSKGGGAGGLERERGRVKNNKATEQSIQFAVLLAHDS